MRRLFGSERGSVSPVFIGLCVVVLLLMAAFLEREWVNYTLKMAEQTADFAAEAGGRMHQVFVTLKASRRQYYTVIEQVCTEEDEEGNCIAWREEPRREERWSYPEVTVAESELLGGDWTALFDCTLGTAWEGDSPEWQCVEVEVLARELQYPAEVKKVVRTTFADNWPNRPAARATVSDVWLKAACRSVEVKVDLQLRPLLGVVPWTAERQIVGKTVTQLRPLRLSGIEVKVPSQGSDCPYRS